MVKNSEIQKLDSMLNLGLARGFGLGAIAGSVVCIGMVVAWAQSNTASNTTSYLGLPDWAVSPLAYHAIFLVAGFFVAQILAINSVLFIDASDPLLSKTTYFYLMVVATASLAIGIAATYNNYTGFTLSTMHSWVGVITMTLYALYITWGCILEALTAYIPKHSKASLMRYQTAVFCTSFISTILAIVTGIQDQLYFGLCVPITNVKPDTFDPSSQYDIMPAGCQIGNGLGIAVMGTAFTIGLSVFYYSESFKRTAA